MCILLYLTIYSSIPTLSLLNYRMPVSAVTRQKWNFTITHLLEKSSLTDPDARAVLRAARHLFEVESYQLEKASFAQLSA